jgi:MerR family glutamine synthetase transcriptional repressor
MGTYDSSSPVYSIGIAQRLTGLSGRQIRYYEKQGLISPSRTKGNRRMFSPAEVDLLLRIKDLIEQGYNIEGVKRVLDSGPEQADIDSRSPSRTAHQIDHESVIASLRQINQLTSLYPVNNRGELERLLHELSRRP